MAKQTQKPEPQQPDSNEQSGSAGRNTAADKLEPGKDTGQDRYGQSGYGGQAGHETIGRANYKRGRPGGDAERDLKSNEGSGRADHEPLEQPARAGSVPSRRRLTD